jgi:SsrA-binding protein
MAIKNISKNRKAYHEYTVGEKFEAGMVLLGTEVKALREGKVNLSDGWVEILNGEAFLRDMHIGHYSHGNILNHDEKRPRKLLLHRKELCKIEKQASDKGLSIIPLEIYFKGPKIKVEVAICRGKKLHDKRQDKKSKEATREIARTMRSKG